MKTIDTYINEKLNLSARKFTCKPKDKYEFKEIIKERLEKDKDADLNDIDVSDITDMKWLFYNFDPHNIDISEWDVSNVKDMKFMFYYCKNFNCDLSNWNVSNVEDMRSMFLGCKKFNCDLSEWDVSNVESTSYMFAGCESLKNMPSWYE